MTPSTAWTSRALRVLGWTTAVLLPLAFLAVFFGWPVVALIGRGFRLDGQWDFSGFTEVLSRSRTWRVIWQTLAQATCGTAVSLLLGIPGAYVFSRLKFPGRKIARAWITVPFVLPTVVVGVAFRALLAEGGPLGFLGLDQTFPALVCALVFFNYAVVVRTVGSLWERLDPRMVQAARTLGASPARAFRTVTLPALAPAIASAASVVFLFCSTAFGIVLVLGGRRFANIEAEIYRQTVQLLDLRAAAVLSVVQLVLVAGSLVLASKSRRSRETALALADAERGAQSITRADVPAVAGTALVVTLLHVLPLGTLVLRSFQSSEGWGLRNYRLLSTTGERGQLTQTVWQATAGSIRIALVATLIAVIVGLLLSLVLSRRPRSRSLRRGIGLLDGAVMLPLGVSAVTVGFGFLITMDKPLGLHIDLRSTGLLIPVAQAVVAIPLVIRTVLSVLRALDPRQREAAAMLGASPIRVLATIDWPVVARSAGLAVGFAFATSLGEFGATSFLVRPDTVTLPVVIFQLIGRPGADNYGMAIAASVILGALAATVMLAAERLRGAGAGEF